jgi:hypothetical protein
MRWSQVDVLFFCDQKTRNQNGAQVSWLSYAYVEHQYKQTSCLTLRENNTCSDENLDDGFLELLRDFIVCVEDIEGHNVVCQTNYGQDLSAAQPCDRKVRQDLSYVGMISN